MANTRIKDLTNDSSPSASDYVAIDADVGGTRNTNLTDLVNAARPFASEAEAIAGTSTTAAMNPLATKQAIESIGATNFATTAQGALADTALQPADVGTSVQAHSSLLDSASALSLVAGDLLVADGANSVTRLAKGGEGQIIGVVGGSLAYKTVPAANLPASITPNTALVANAAGTEYEGKATGSTGLDVLAAETQEIAAGIIGQFGSRADATASSLRVAPDYIRTAGYTNPGDGGGALYKKVASEPSHAGKFSITLSDAVTVVWYELAQNPVHAAMFGAFPDGTNAQPGLQAMISYLGAVGGVGQCDIGTYNLEAMVSINSAAKSFILRGAGRKATTWKRITNTAYNVFRVFNSDGVTVEDITFDANGTALSSNSHCVYVYQSDDFTANRCEFRDAPAFTCFLGEGDSTNYTNNCHLNECIADTGANGLFFAYHRYSGFHACKAANITGAPGYGLQFKNDCQYCYMSDCSAVSCDNGMAFGQETADGVDASTISNFTARQCEYGIVLGYATRNVFTNITLDQIGEAGVLLDAGCKRNAFSNVVVDGDNVSTVAVKINGTGTDANVVNLAYVRDVAYICAFTDTCQLNKVVLDSDNILATGLVAAFTDTGGSGNKFIWKVSGTVSPAGASSVAVTHSYKYTVPASHVLITCSLAMDYQPRIESNTNTGFTLNWGSPQSGTVTWRVVD